MIDCWPKTEAIELLLAFQMLHGGFLYFIFGAVNYPDFFLVIVYVFNENQTNVVLEFLKYQDYTYFNI